MCPILQGFQGPLESRAPCSSWPSGAPSALCEASTLALSEAGRASDVTLVLGVRTPSLVPLEGELASLVREGARVVVCLSDEPAAPMPPFEVRDGLVQAAVDAELTARPGHHAAVLVAGPKAMMDDFRSREEAFGVPVLANA
jgi:NAD(P)H-flavin reductase